MSIPTLISRIFDPFLVMTAVSVIAVSLSSLSISQMLLFLGLLFTFMAGFPALLLWLAIKRGIIKNWDISDRRQRPKALIILLLINLVSFVIVTMFHNSDLTNLYLLYVFWLIGFLFITLFWKISGHTSVNTLSLGILVMIYGFSIWPSLIILPVIAWARYVRKDHTIGQLIAGVLYSLVVLGVYRIFFQ